MSISALPSTKHSSHAGSRRKCVSHKRRRNQNAEIDELASLVPLSTFHGALSPSSSITTGAEDDQTTSSSPSMVPLSSGCSGNSPGAVDKLSVLRLASTYFKLQQFMKDVTHVNGSDAESVKHPFGVIEEAIDGFLIVLDKEANILYVSETITDCVGLRQQDVIGQHLADITHPSSAIEIKDGLKPSVTFPSSVPEPDGVFSQHRQFYVRFKSTVYNSRITSHTMVQVDGSLKVKLPPLLKTAMEFVKPSVIGFVGECRRVESEYSALDMLIPLTSFCWTKNLDRKVVAVDETFKDVTGFDPEAILSGSGDIGPEFVHPADIDILLPLQTYFLQNGHVVSPQFRALIKSGEWIWITIEVAVRCKSGTTIPQFIEFKGRVLSQGVGKVKYAVPKNTYVPPPSLDELRLPDDVLSAILLARIRQGAVNLSLIMTGCTNCKLSNFTRGRDQAETDRGKAVAGASWNPSPVIAAATASDPAASQPTSSRHRLCGSFGQCNTTVTPSDSCSLMPVRMDARSSYMYGRDIEKWRRDLFSSHAPVGHSTGKHLKPGMLTQAEDKMGSPVTPEASSPLELSPIDYPFPNSSDPPISDGVFSETTCSSLDSTPSLSCTDLSHSSHYSSSNCYPMDPGTIAAGSTFTVSSASSDFELFGQSDCHSSNVSSLEFDKFNSMTTPYFSTFPSHAPLTSSDAPIGGSPESIVDSLPETRSSTLNPTDPLMHAQTSSNIHVNGMLMNGGRFNFDAVTYSQHWKNWSTELNFLEAGGNCSSHYLSREPSCHVYCSNTNQTNLEVQDILQQFM